MKKLLVFVFGLLLMSSVAFAEGENAKTECKFSLAALTRAETAAIEKSEDNKPAVKKEKERAAGE